MDSPAVVTPAARDDDHGALLIRPSSCPFTIEEKGRAQWTEWDTRYPLWSPLRGPEAYVAGDGYHPENPLALAVARLDALVADCRKGHRGSIPAWLRRDNVLQLLEHMLREIAAADPERRP